MEDVPIVQGETSGGKSYHDSLMNPGNDGSRWCLDEDAAVDMGFESLENPSDGTQVDRSNPLCPNIMLDDKENVRLARPFHLSLIVKLLDRAPGLRTLGPRIVKMSGKKGRVEVVDIDMDFFLVDFQSKEDYNTALTGGPWIVMDSYLVRRWKLGLIRRRR